MEVVGGGRRKRGKETLDLKMSGCNKFTRFSNRFGCGNISVTEVLIEYPHYPIALCVGWQRQLNSEMAQGSCHIA